MGFTMTAQGKTYVLFEREVSLRGGEKKIIFYSSRTDVHIRETGFHIREQAPRGALIDEAGLARTLVMYRGLTPYEAAVSVAVLADKLSPMGPYVWRKKVQTLLRDIENPPSA